MNIWLVNSQNIELQQNALKKGVCPKDQRTLTISSFGHSLIKNEIHCQGSNPISFPVEEGQYVDQTHDYDSFLIVDPVPLDQCIPFPVKAIKTGESGIDLEKSVSSVPEKKTTFPQKTEGRRVARKRIPVREKKTTFRQKVSQLNDRLNSMTLENISDDCLPMLLNIFQSFNMCFEDMYSSSKTPLKSVENILMSTKFDSENDVNTNQNLEAPQTGLVLFFITKFFQYKKINGLALDSCEEEFLKHMNKSYQIVSLMKIIRTYFKEENSEKLLKLIKKDIENQILKLKEKERIALPGGWLDPLSKEGDSIEGHYMIYLIERKDSSTFTKKRINTHITLENSHVIEEETIEAKNITTFISDIIDLYFPQLLLPKTKRHRSRQK